MPILPLRVPPPFQLGYVVDDVEAAIDYWTRVIGAGPFFVYPANQWEELWYRGERIDIDIDIALGQWGGTQIEFVTQKSNGPSPYQAFREAGCRGLHHHGTMVHDLDAAIALMTEAGKPPVYWGTAAGGVRFAYLVEDEHPGTMIELIEHGPLIDAMMKMVADAAIGWDGSDPVRQPDLSKLAL